MACASISVETRYKLVRNRDFWTTSSVWTLRVMTYKDEGSLLIDRDIIAFLGAGAKPTYGEGAEFDFLVTRACSRIALAASCDERGPSKNMPRQPFVWRRRAPLLFLLGAKIAPI